VMKESYLLGTGCFGGAHGDAGVKLRLGLGTSGTKRGQTDVRDEPLLEKFSLHSFLGLQTQACSMGLDGWPWNCF
jgi:hypothetical protein